jgi:hypothetical protein
MLWIFTKKNVKESQTSIAIQIYWSKELTKIQNHREFKKMTSTSLYTAYLRVDQHLYKAAYRDLYTFLWLPETGWEVSLRTDPAAL